MNGERGCKYNRKQHPLTSLSVCDPFHPVPHSVINRAASIALPLSITHARVQIRTKCTITTTPQSSSGREVYTVMTKDVLGEVKRQRTQGVLQRTAFTRVGRRTHCPAATTKTARDGDCVRITQHFLYCSTPYSQCFCITLCYQTVLPAQTAIRFLTLPYHVKL